MLILLHGNQIMRIRRLGELGNDLLLALDEMSPGFLHGLSVKRTHERATRRTLWFLEQAHAGLLGRTVTLLAIALDAGNNDVFPGGSSTAVPGNHMIHVQLLGGEVFSAVLTAVIISFQKILAIELHFLHQHPVIASKQQDRRHHHLLVDRSNHSASRTGFQILGEFEPTCTVKNPKTTIFRIDHLGVLEGEQTKGPLDSHYVDRLPKTVEHEGLKVSVHPN